MLDRAPHRETRIKPQLHAFKASERLLHFSERNPGISVLEFAEAVVNVVHTRRIDVIHAQPYLSLLPSALAAPRLGIPYVVTFHGPPNLNGFIDHFGVFFLEALSNFILPRASAIVTVSEEVRDAIATAFGVDQGLVQVIRNPISITDFGPIEPAAPPARGILISRLDEDKEHSIAAALDLFIELKELDKRWAFQVVGDGVLAGSLRAQAESRGLGDIHWMGARPYAHDLIPANSIVLGMGRVILEAIAARRVAILSGVNGLAGVIDSGAFRDLQRCNFSGRNVPPLSAESLARQVRHALDSGAYPFDELLGYLDGEHDARSFAEASIKIYRTALARPSSSASNAECAAVGHWLTSVGKRSLRTLDWTETPGALPGALFGASARKLVLLGIARSQVRADRRVRELMPALEDANARVLQAEGVLVGAQSQLQQTEGELRSARSAALVESSRAEGADARSRMLADELDQARATSRQLEAVLDLTRSQLQALETDFVQVRVSAEPERARGEAADARARALETEREQVRAKALERVSALELQIGSLEGQLTAQKVEIVAALEAAEAARRQGVQSSEELHRERCRSAELADWASKQAAHIQELAWWTKEQEACINRLSSHAANLEAEIGNLQSQIAGARLKMPLTVLRRTLHRVLDTVQTITPAALRAAVRPMYLRLYYRVFPTGRPEVGSPAGTLFRTPTTPVRHSQLNIGDGEFGACTTTPISWRTVYHASHQPKITVVLPVWNQAEMLPIAISSVLDQTYRNLELIVVDDGSTTDLLPILERYVADPRILFVRKPHSGLPGTLSAGFRYATGDFLTWTSADNLMKPRMLETLLGFLLRRPDIDMTYGNEDLIDASGAPLFHSDYRVSAQRPNQTNILDLPRTIETLGLLNDNFIGACFLYRSEIGRMIGSYDDSLLGTEDYDYWLRLSLIGSIAHIDCSESLYSYRVHDDSISGRDTPAVARNAVALIQFHAARKDFHNQPFEILIMIGTVPTAVEKTALAIARTLQASNHRVRVARQINNAKTWISETSALCECKPMIVWFAEDDMPSTQHDGAERLRTIPTFRWIPRRPAPEKVRATGLSSGLNWGLVQWMPMDREWTSAGNQDWLLFTPSRYSFDDELALMRKARDNVSPMWDLPEFTAPLLLYIGPIEPQWLDSAALCALAAEARGTILFISSSQEHDNDPRTFVPRATNIVYLGHKRFTEWHVYLSRASVLLAPFSEALGVEDHVADVILTYLMAGKPVLATEAVRSAGFGDSPSMVVCPPQEFADALEAALRMRSEPSIHDGYLERRSPRTMAKRLLGVANTRLAYERLQATEGRVASSRVGDSRRRTCLMETKSLGRGGLERVVADLSCALCDRGFRVVIGVAGPEGEIASECRSRGITVHVVRESEEAFSSVIESEGVEILVPHYSYMGMRAAWKAGIPVLHVIHNSYIWTDARMDREVRSADRFVSRYVAVSHPTSSFFCRKYGVSPEKIVTIPNGIDISRCAEELNQKPEITRETLGLSDEDTVFVSVASIIGTKAQLHGIAAMAALADKYPRLRLLLVGPVADVRYYNVVKDALSAPGMRRRVKLCPETNRVFDYYRLADAFVLTSLTEGWSVATTEAMLAGLPLLLTDVGGASEALECGGKGILVPPAYTDATTITASSLWDLCTDRNPRNLSALIDGFGAVVENLEALQYEARAGRALVASRLAWDVVADEYASEIEAVLARHGAGRARSAWASGWASSATGAASEANVIELLGRVPSAGVRD